MAHPATVQALKRAAGEVYTSGGYIRSNFIVPVLSISKHKWFIYFD